MEEALEAGAADFVEEDNVLEIYSGRDDRTAVADGLTAKGYTFISSEVEKVPSNYVTLENEDDIKFMNLLIENLEENEDIVNVWHNWEE
jgi:transcriptional/translational regulatory protein YebC/TACO1